MYVLLLLLLLPLLGNSHRLTNNPPNKQTPDQLLPKLFGELRERYADRPGGYTRVLRIEPLNRHNKLDQAESAILEFVDGNVDTRFAMTAAAVARSEALGRKLHPNTVLNVKKVTAFRKDGPAEFRAMVRAIKQSGRVNKFPSSETENADWHLDRYAQKQAAYETQLEEWNDLRKQKYQTDVPAQAEDKREGRGARQRRLRREKKAAYGPDAAEGEAQHGTAASEWEDLEDATEADGKDKRVHREKPAVRGSRGRSLVKRLRKPVKPTLGVKIRAPKKARASF